MHKFNEITVVSNYIKQFLHDHNLLNVKFFVPGMYVIKDLVYVYDRRFYQAMKSTFCESVFDDTCFVSLDVPYTPNKSVFNYSKNYIGNSKYYDTATHEYLGDYLRYYRDSKHIDLMPLYNCFSNHICTNIDYDIVRNNSAVSFDSSDKNSIIYMIPVRPLNTYTIAVESPMRVEMFAGFYSDNNLMWPEDVNYSKTYFEVSDARFAKPFIYDKLSLENLQLTSFFTNEHRLYLFDKSLYLFLRVPFNLKSSVVVIENGGKYNQFINGAMIPDDPDISDKSVDQSLVIKMNKTIIPSNRYIVDCYSQEEQIEDLDATNATNDQALMKIPTKINSNSQLLRINTGESYPFADRLVEYLFQNVITPDDEIKENILSVQKNLVENHKLFNVEMESYWDNDLTMCLRDIILNADAQNKYDDILGYVDKDVEKLINLS